MVSILSFTAVRIMANVGSVSLEMYISKQLPISEDPCPSWDSSHKKLFFSVTEEVE